MSRIPTYTEEEFAAGYEQESERAAEASKDDWQCSTHAAESKAATTFYADDAPPSKRGKFNRLHALHCGEDSHRAQGCSVDDVGKVEEKNRAKVRFAHSIANTLGLPDVDVERAKSLVESIDGAKFSRLGGLEALLHGAVAYCARDLGREPYEDCGAFRVEVDLRLGGKSELDDAVEQVAAQDDTLDVAVEAELLVEEMEVAADV